ncbi:MAG: ribosome maturation factor RimM [Bacteroidales bacterium]|jgi:16S rRNA processing protein RimM|nr:ribosome maturation factor RimM [Bacteroidales bacterium]
MNDYFYLGVITKTFGYKGQIVIYLDTDEPDKYKTLEAVFVKEDDEFLPYIIEEFIYKGNNQAVLKLEDVDGETAKKLLRAELYLPISFLPPLTGNKFYFHEVIGFEVIDTIKGSIGKCGGFIEMSRQPIMQIDNNGKEVLIPVVDDFFDKIDRENKAINISAPEGLIEIYLDE